MCGCDDSNQQISYADSAWQGEVEVLEHGQIAESTFRLKLTAGGLGQSFTPGQFVMLRLPGLNDPLLARPIAIYDLQSEPETIELVYIVVGKMTSMLCQIETGMKLQAWGPLGNGFSLKPTEHLVLVAGGIGQTPLLTLADAYLGQRRFGDKPTQLAAKVTLCYGARTDAHLASVDDFRKAGVEVRLSTDDGSVGHAGRVTELLEPVLTAAQESDESCRIAACGPRPMLRAVQQIAQQHELPSEVSLESPMACGIGICFGCVEKVQDDDGTWDFRRTCVEGPVFDGAKIDFSNNK